MITLNKITQFGIKVNVGIIALTIFSASAAETMMASADTALSFKQAITVAQKNDPWLTGNIHQQKALESMSVAVGTLPDPTVSIGLANLPTNGFDFGQEGMTQAKVGITQMFPRGETLKFKSQQLKLQSEMFPQQRLDRESKVAVTVGSLWLDAYQVQQSIALIEKNKALFEQLADIAKASYSSAVGKTRQQDIVRAQLELTRLEERLDKLGQQKNRFEGMLLQWLTQISDDNSATEDVSLAATFSLHNIVLSEDLPKIALINHQLVYQDNWLQPNDLVPYFAKHPAVVAIDKKVKATKTGITLAKQKYQPQWGVNASYGYRADDPMGNSRADLFSVGVSFDLPIFTENRQDKEVQSAISTTEAVKTEKLLLLRKFISAYASSKGRLQRLKSRQQLYKSKLLPQMYDHVEAALTGYTHDDGDFTEVVRSRIAVLNAEIDDLALNVEEQKILLELNYLLIGSIDMPISKNKIDVINNGEYVTTFDAVNFGEEK